MAFNSKQRRDWVRSPKGRLSIRAYNLKRVHNIDLLAYNELFQKQHGLCAGCYKHQSNFKRALAVDHDHVTGNIRGLLCIGCNVALGCSKDNPATLRRLADYLEFTIN